MSEERSSCARCGIRSWSGNLRGIGLPSGELRLCQLCWNEFWNWFAERRVHTAGGDRVTSGADGLTVSLCGACRCELDHWRVSSRTGV